MLDCSENGILSVKAKSCLFIHPDDTFANRNKVFTVQNSDKSQEFIDDEKCSFILTDTNSHYEKNWTYKEAIDCGWEWVTDETKMHLKTYLRNNVNRILENFMLLTIGKF